MASAYEVLGVRIGCEDREVRRRYLELVRQFPPDRNPQRFAAIRKAYEQLRDPETRVTAVLFPSQKDDSLVNVIADVMQRLRGARIPPDTLLSLAERR
jgi:DnaJ-class molecular chaperone